MAHTRKRNLKALIDKLASFWPVTGLIGARQVGKTTFLKEEYETESRTLITFDNDAVREDAQKSSSIFIAKLDLPVIIDEVQKVPKIFDAIKAHVDRKRIPGQFLITGSTQFSAKVGIRESLTGRIGIAHLHPMNLAEVSQVSQKGWDGIVPSDNPRFNVSDFSHQMVRGGVPVSLFARTASTREMFWSSWLETLVYRDLSQLIKRGFNAELAFRLLSQIGAVLQRGELPTLKHFSVDSRKARLHLEGLETLLVLRKFSCHERGVGKEVWLPFDSGLAAHLMQTDKSEGATLTLARIFWLNELSCYFNYNGKRIDLTYYKSAKGAPIDFVHENAPFKLVTSLNRIGWEERALHGAMKNLKSKLGYLIAPVDKVQQESNIKILPWTLWS